MMSTFWLAKYRIFLDKNVLGRTTEYRGERELTLFQASEIARQTLHFEEEKHAQGRA